MEKGYTPLSRLIGDPEENYYQLGLKDRALNSPIFHHMDAQFLTSDRRINQLIKTFTSAAIYPYLKSEGEFKGWIRAYSEGIQEPLGHLAQTLFLPDLISAISGIKQLPLSLLGCSSIFCLNEDGQPMHARLLDFPLWGSYDRFERGLVYQFKNYPQLFSMQSIGVPFPGVTAMNDEGMTLAIHQKFSPEIDLKGLPIMELATMLLMNCHDKKSVLKFLKTHKPFTNWGLYLSFKSGDVLEIDVGPKGLVKNEYQLKEDSFLSFTNVPLKSGHDHCLPWSMKWSNEQRSLSHQKRANEWPKKKKTEANFLKLMGKNMIRPSKNWGKIIWDGTAPNTVTNCVLNAQKGHCENLPGMGPKVFRGKTTALKNLWLDPKEDKEVILKDLTPYQEGMRHLIQSQTFWDCGDTHSAYHHVQMAHDKWQDFPQKHFCTFFLLCFQTLHETHGLVLQDILEKWQQLCPLLPTYHQDHCKMMIWRIKRHLRPGRKIQLPQLQHEELTRVLEKELNVHGLISKYGLRVLVKPRMDILDIIYLHSLL